ncbi:MAG: hypothetical protein DRR42_07515 [Gammaproteobacteria bacterium]|nr:MAG: hypothetical protein DRR42_07515 [Gammaproteobacteria bacterium]
MRLIKLLVFYPMRPIGGWVILAGNLLAAFFLFGAFLVIALQLAGELEIDGWIIGFCVVAGLGFRAFNELYTRILIWSSSASERSIWADR